MRADVINAVASSITTGIMVAIGLSLRYFLRMMNRHTNEHEFLMNQVKTNTDHIKKILVHVGLDKGETT